MGGCPSRSRCPCRILMNWAVSPLRSSCLQEVPVAAHHAGEDLPVVAKSFRSGPEKAHQWSLVLLLGEFDNGGGLSQKNEKQK
jgi:hypothetical protein